MNFIGLRPFKSYCCSEEKVGRFFRELEEKNQSINTIEILIFHGKMKEHTNPKYKDQRRKFLKELGTGCSRNIVFFAASPPCLLWLSERDVYILLLLAGHFLTTNDRSVLARMKECNSYGTPWIT